jgi:hypothetical protein
LINGERATEFMNLTKLFGATEIVENEEATVVEKSIVDDVSERPNGYFLKAAVSEFTQDPRCPYEAELNGFHEQIAKGTTRDPFDRVRHMKPGSTIPNFRSSMPRYPTRSHGH